MERSDPSRQQTCDLRVPGNDGEHERAEPELSGDVEIGSMIDQCCNDFSMTSVRRKHESCLSIAIAGIHIYATIKKVGHICDITALNCVFPDNIHACPRRPAIERTD